MSTGPRNALSDLRRLATPLLPLLPGLGNFQQISRDELSVLNGNVEIEDRRRFALHHRYPVRTAIEAIGELERLAGGSGSRWLVDEVIAVRGDRGALLRIAGQVADGSEFEFLELDFYDRDMRPARIVLFDLDAADEAIELLDALHAEDAEPADPNAIARATEGWLVLRNQLLGSSPSVDPDGSSAPEHGELLPPD